MGGGLAGLCAYATLRHGGLEPDGIVVFGDRTDPTEAWAARAHAIRQRRMRSESDGHVAATSFPGLAVRSGKRRCQIRARRGLVLPDDCDAPGREPVEAHFTEPASSPWTK